MKTLKLNNDAILQMVYGENKTCKLNSPIVE